MASKADNLFVPKKPANSKKTTASGQNAAQSSAQNGAKGAKSTKSLEDGLGLHDAGDGRTLRQQHGNLLMVTDTSFEPVQPEAMGTKIDEEDDEDDLELGNEGDYAETDLEVEGVLKKKEQLDIYSTACKVLGIVPASDFLSLMNSAEVSIRHRGLGPKGAQAIAVVLESNSTITKLDLSSNWIESGGAYLGRSLQINRTLVTLDLSDNKLGLLGGADIAEMLGYNSTLRNLCLSGNTLGDKEAVHLAEGLRQNSTLQVLDVSHNTIGDMGAIALGAGLAGNDSLKELNLAWNHIRSRGIGGFLMHIKDNPVLSTLNLQNNGLGENGQAVGAYLLKTNAIVSLDLSRTRITDAALITIAKGLEQNYSIKDLDVSENPFGDQGAPAFFKAILSSNCLRKIHLRSLKFTKETRAKLEELKAEKPEITFFE
ncbi:hypothetical protein HDU67_005993 [Dinochytrium kinnereticum]|nr:hypothetical protein HDU67_005993 [Dinochytrium kinnereticum]